MMFSCSALPPPLYPAVLRPSASLSSPLTRSLPTGFLVEDILRLSQPVTYIQRTLSSRNPSDIVTLSPGPDTTARTLEPGADRSLSPNCRSSGCPQTACTESGLKFGVSAILAPSTRSVHSFQNKSFSVPFTDGSLHPFVRASYFTAGPSFLLCGPSSRNIYMAPGSQREAQKGHAAASCILRPPEKGPGENFPETEIHQQTRQEETGQ